MMQLNYNRDNPTVTLQLHKLLFKQKKNLISFSPSLLQELANRQQQRSSLQNLLKIAVAINNNDYSTKDYALKQISSQIPQKSNNKSIHIKISCHLILNSICYQNSNSMNYFSVLMNQIKQSYDLQQALMIIFGVKSLIKYENFNFNQNLQIPENQISLNIYLWLLIARIKFLQLQTRQQGLIALQRAESLIRRAKQQNKRQQQFQFLQKYIYQQKIKQKNIKKISEDSSSKKFVSTPQKQDIIDKKNHDFIDLVIRKLISCEKQFQKKKNMNFLQNNDILQKTKKALINYLNFKYEAKIKEQKMTLIQLKQYDIIQSLLENLNIALLQKMQTSEYLTKILNNFAPQVLKTLNKYQKNKINNFNLGFQKQNFRTEYINQQKINNQKKYQECKAGQYLIKYNYNNKNSDEKYLKLCNEGVKWSQDERQIDSNSTLMKWKHIKGLVYGHQTKNIRQKCRLQPWKCFSLLCNDRTLDFGCTQQNDIFFWLSGITYHLKNHQKTIVKQYRTGMILWKKVLMKLKYTNKLHNKNLKNNVSNAKTIIYASKRINLLKDSHNYQNFK